MFELDYFIVLGDVIFGKNVLLKGMVIIIVNYGDRIDILFGVVLENKIVFGNFCILDYWNEKYCGYLNNGLVFYNEMFFRILK